MPFTVDGIVFSVEGLAGFYASAVAAGALVGILMVALTLAYRRA